MLRSDVAEFFEMFGLTLVAVLDPFHLLGAVIFDPVDLNEAVREGRVAP